MADPIARLNAALEGRYRIERQLGEGGMATVHLANDLRHERKVALKVLKPELAAVVGAGRFLAEIKTTANLQHPHILPLFDSGEADKFLFYVMPYVEGESLRERLDREHQLAVDEAVQIAKNVAEALHYAHKQGVIHRDIKPANILLQAGKPVVSDFGIALAVGAAGGGRLTETGLSLGTPHYMSPEQATGDLSVGAATDIYALGCVLYEMLVGEPPYTGSTTQAILGKIIAGELASATKHRSSVPANVDAAIRKALEKLPADRFASSARLAQGLADPTFRHRTQLDDAPGHSDQRWWPRAVAGALVGASLAVLASQFVPANQGSMPEVRYYLDFPAGEEPTSLGDVSPDGELLVYVGPGPQLWIRERDELSGAPIEGTEGGIQPTFSPDGDRLAFITAQSELKVVSVSGGLARVLVEANVRLSGVAWSEDGYLYFTSEPSLALHRVRADGTGDQPEQLTEVDLAQGEVQHGGAVAIPGGRGVLFRHALGAEPAIAVLDTRSMTHEVVAAGRRQRYATTGHLLFTRLDGSLYAAPFDRSRLERTGPEVPIFRGLRAGPADFVLSSNGRLIFRAGTSSTPVWVSRDGTAVPAFSSWSGGSQPEISPDGTRVSYNASGDIWTRDLEGGTPVQLTFDGSNSRPVWLPGGESVAFLGVDGVWARRVDGTAPPQLLLEREARIAHAIVSGDGASWVLRLMVPDDRGDLYQVTLGDSVDRPLRATSAAERAPALDPNGLWLAYTSNESGQDEVYVLSTATDEDGPTRISMNGGTQPVWANDGTELFYVNGSNELVAIRVNTGDEFFAGAQTALFSWRPYPDVPNGRSYDVSNDAERFLIFSRQPDAGAERPIVVENFFAELCERMGDC